MLLQGHPSIGTGIGLGSNFVRPGAELTDNIIAASDSGAHNAIVVGTGAHDLLFQNNIMLNATAVLVLGPINNMQMLNNTWDNQSFDLPLLEFYGSAESQNLVATGNRFYASQRSPSTWFELSTGSSSFANWQSFSGETGNNNPVSWVDGGRTLASYHQSLGGTADDEAFFMAAMTQVRLSFNSAFTAPAFIAYLRAGLVQQ